MKINIKINIPKNNIVFKNIFNQIIKPMCKIRINFDRITLKAPFSKGVSNQ
jgi:hypothetical protein